MPGLPGTGQGQVLNFDWLKFGITHGYVDHYEGPGTDTPHFAVDIGTKQGTPVTALFKGHILHSKTGLPWGTEIFIQADNGMTYYYYHLDSLLLSSGAVEAGQLIGYSGGQNSGGSNPSTPGNSSGPHTHVGYFTNYINTPIGSRPFGPDITLYIKALTNGDPYKSVNEQSSTAYKASQNILGATFAKVQNPLKPNDTVTELLQAIDQFQSVTPFWQIDLNQINHVVILGQDTGVVDPIAFTQQLAFNFTADLAALIIDGVLILAGVFICFKIFSRLVNLGGVVRSGTQVAAAGARLALL